MNASKQLLLLVALLAMSLIAACSGEADDRNSSGDAGNQFNDTDPATACGSFQQTCCSGNACNHGLNCQQGICVHLSEGDVGTPCTRNADCDSDLCLPLSGGRAVCTEACTTTGECTPGWDCNPMAGVESDVCMPIDGVIDLLWMIDNSASMCRAQRAIGENISDLLAVLETNEVDFQFGIVTTHMTDSSPFEPVAQPGRLQSTPQPLPGYNPICLYPLNASGEPIFGSTALMRENLELAISCTANPADWEFLRDVDDADLLCALDAHRFNPSCEPHTHPLLDELFPPQSAYRSFPLLFRSQDYRDGQDNFDRDRFIADFTCASMVGTRGYGFEQGLASVVKATSPQMLAGQNAGLIRDDSRFGVIFISDENDCSHDGSLNEQASCGTSICTIEENLGADGALIPVDELVREFFGNIAAARGINTGDNSLQTLKNAVGPFVMAASLHGSYQRDMQASPADCQAGFEITPSCSSDYGPAWSGHRYAEFLSHFWYFYPDYRNTAGSTIETEQIEGHICSDISARFAEIGEALFQ